MGKEIDFVAAVSVKHARDQILCLFPGIVTPYEKIGTLIPFRLCAFKKILVFKRGMPGHEIEQDRKSSFMGLSDQFIKII